MKETDQTNTIDLTTIEHREVTGGINGYPVPVLGVALFADTLDELKKLSNKLNLDENNVYGTAEIHEFKWKSGWFNCTDNGEQFDPENYATTAETELRDQDYPSEWDIESVTEIGYSDDASHYRLGLFIDFSEGWQYADGCKEVEFFTEDED